jgi:hypothetical protein
LIQKLFTVWTNPSHTSLWIPTFDPTTNDLFIKDYLWPCLLMLSTACNTQLFLSVSKPRWSQMTSYRIRKQYRNLYEILDEQYQDRKGKQEFSNPKFSVLDLCDYEMSPSYKKHVRWTINRLKMLDIDAVEKQKLVDFVYALGGQWDHSFGKDYCGFLKQCVLIYDHTNKFSEFDPPSVCKAFPGDKQIGISCFNPLCKEKHLFS